MTVIIKHFIRDLDVYESWTFLSTVTHIFLYKGLIAETLDKEEEYRTFNSFLGKRIELVKIFG